MTKITKVLSRDKKFLGILTGEEISCDMEGCTGVCLEVRWKDGQVSYPCTKGMDIIKYGRSKVLIIRSIIP